MQRLDNCRTSNPPFHPSPKPPNLLDLRIQRSHPAWIALFTYAAAFSKIIPHNGNLTPTLPITTLHLRPHPRRRHRRRRPLDNTLRADALQRTTAEPSRRCRRFRRRRARRRNNPAAARSPAAGARKARARGKRATGGGRARSTRLAH